MFPFHFSLSLSCVYDTPVILILYKYVCMYVCKYVLAPLTFDIMFVAPLIYERVSHSTQQVVLFFVNIRFLFLKFLFLFVRYFDNVFILKCLPLATVYSGTGQPTRHQLKYLTHTYFRKNYLS